MLVKGPATVLRIRRRSADAPVREVAGGVIFVVSGCRRAARMAAWILALWVAAAPLIGGCAKSRGNRIGAAASPASAGPRRGDQSVPLTVFAAASLTECLDEFAQHFERNHAGATVRANYAGTQELRIQVEQGARCDVFVSASEPHMQSLVQAGYISQARILARNRLCVAADARSRKVTSLADLAHKGVRLVVATETCPVGAYTRQCWELMKRRLELGPEYVSGLQSNVVSEETNVKLVLVKVLMGEADAGFVYASDVLHQDVVTIELPAAVQVEATYMVGIMDGTRSPEAARSYVDGLLSAEGAQLLRSTGLTVPEAWSAAASAP